MLKLVTIFYVGMHMCHIFLYWVALKWITYYYKQWWGR